MLSVVIVSWNTSDLLAHCLESLFEPAVASGESPSLEALANRMFEVLVVDNASADGSADMVRQRFPQVRVFENHENVGFARANNQAFSHASGQYVLLLNPDTLVRSGALQALLAFMDNHPEAGAAGARLLNADGTLQPSCSPAPTLLRELWRLFHLDMLWPYASYSMAEWGAMGRREVDVVQGACLIVRREALDGVGMLDEDYFIYSEEVDLCQRLRRRGWKVYWVPEAAVVHYGGQSTRQRAAAMFVQLYQAKVVYFRKHHGALVARLYKLILLIAAVARLLISPLAWLERSQERQQHLVLVGHYRQLLKVLPRL